MGEEREIESIMKYDSRQGTVALLNLILYRLLHFSTISDSLS